MSKCALLKPESAYWWWFSLRLSYTTWCCRYYIHFFAYKILHTFAAAGFISGWQPHAVPHKYILDFDSLFRRNIGFTTNKYTMRTISWHLHLNYAHRYAEYFLPQRRYHHQPQTDLLENTFLISRFHYIHFSASAATTYIDWTFRAMHSTTIAE